MFARALECVAWPIDVAAIRPISRSQSAHERLIEESA